MLRFRRLLALSSALLVVTSGDRQLGYYCTIVTASLGYCYTTAIQTAACSYPNGLTNLLTFSRTYQHQTHLESPH